MYKDKNKQRKATKEATRRYRAKKADSALSGQKDGSENARGSAVLDKVGDTQPVIPSNVIPPRVSDQDFTRLMATAGHGHVRVSQPGDIDYEPQCETTKAFIEDRPKDKLESKRGRDIKVFDDLPPDVQQTIDIMSIVDGKMDLTIKANRTAIAIHYQHTFPGRY